MAKGHRSQIKRERNANKDSYFLCTVNCTEHYLICQGQNRGW